jgi:hypothetical protein
MADQRTPIQTLPVIDAATFVVHNGANLGDALGIAEDLVLDDIYRLSDDIPLSRLALQVEGDQFRICADSERGSEGAVVFLDCALTFMTPAGDTTDILVLVELEDTGMIAASYLVALAALAPRTDYSLVGIDTDNARQKLAQVACVSFTRGTHITMADGAQVQVEQLCAGDRVLTRGNGVQEIRWIGQSTSRAVGELAPVCIRKGALNNAHDLVVSPDHRLFIYQRSDEIGAGRSELMVKARHLVNGDTVVRLQGGFVDYFQLLFDNHQIIYAEGIATESFLIDARTAPAIPDALSEKLNAGKSNAEADMSDMDVSRNLLDRPDAAELLRRASTR